MMQKRRAYFFSFLLSLPLTIMLLSPITANANTEDNSQSDSVIGRLLTTNAQYLPIYPYESNYLIYTYTDHFNKESIKSYSWAEHGRKDEAKFQISLGFPIYRGIFGENSLIGASYTQRSWWQAFNPSQSSPFRETNYEPQIFVGFVTDYQLLGWSVNNLEMGFNHQSNGREKNTSRSWNRLYIRASAIKDNFHADLKVWYRIPESSRTDDNPDMTRYLGYYQLTFGYDWDKTILSSKIRYNWNSGYGSVELGISYPLNDNIRLYTQLFSGYGESMIDYNYKQTRIGVGFMLNDLF